MESLMSSAGPIGVFDSGYGGLTILDKMTRRLPQYDYLYLGDNARTPYGTRSFETVYRFTLQAVKELFGRGCHLVILACNTASAKALRNIQQIDLPKLAPDRRVLGVIRPTVEAVATLSKTNHIGIVATPGTVASRSYEIELQKLNPLYQTFAHACPMWVPLIENNELATPGAEFFIARDTKALMEKSDKIDTVILGCTHYPLIKEQIKANIKPGVNIIEQGEIVARSLEDYLQRHPEIDEKCSKGGKVTYLTTDDPQRFDNGASLFLGREIKSQHINLN